MICRDCKDCIHPADTNVKYAIRHYLHGKCAVKRGAEFLRTLHEWQLMSLPAMALDSAGLLDFVKSELAQRTARRDEYNSRRRSL